MKNKIIFMGLLCFVLMLNSCGKSPVEPELTPGRRDYNWTRDTLRADPLGFQVLTGIWGSLPNDIWVIGDAATYVNKVWHYDGTKWKNYLLNTFASPIKIWGVSTSEIWMVTTTSDIWKYDGTKWFKYTTIVPQGYQRILFEDIYGYSNDIYAVGIAEKADGDYTGIVIHYDGYKWSILNTPQIKEYFNNIRFLKGGDILISGQNYFDPNVPSRLYNLKDSNLYLLKKSTLGIFLQTMDNKMYVGIDRKINEYKDNSLIEIVDLTTSSYQGSLYGRTVKDFFSANEGWNLGHYNGADMINIYNLGGYINNAQIFENEVFILCYTLDGVNYILHGKLK